MTKPERGFEAAPVSRGGEVPFELSEMFYSHTDRRGVIRFANDVFCRVAGYTADDMVGAPHKIVRHPDMPKALFRVMWQALEAGKVVGAYVKNSSKDGRYYWVFAMASPTVDGYLSVRIKPTSQMLGTVQAIYAECREMENGGATIEASVDHLMARIDALGYKTYDAFQSVALATEYAEREGAASKINQSVPMRLRAAADAALSIRKVTTSMLIELKAVRTVPMNMRILASRLENAGGPISAISVNYGAMLDEMSAWVKTFSKGDNSQLSQMSNSILFAQFLMLVSLLQDEMCDTQQSLEHQDEVTMLNAQAAGFRDEAARALGSVELEAAKLARGVMDMKRYVTGLSSTRMLCKIESASLDVGGQALAGIVDQLDACQQNIEGQLGRISELNGVIQSHATQLQAGRI